MSLVSLITPNETSPGAVSSLVISESGIGAEFLPLRVNVILPFCGQSRPAIALLALITALPALWVFVRVVIFPVATVPASSEVVTVYPSGSPCSDQV